MIDSMSPEEFEKRLVGVKLNSGETIIGFEVTDMIDVSRVPKGITNAIYLFEPYALIENYMEDGRVLITLRRWVELTSPNQPDILPVFTANMLSVFVPSKESELVRRYIESVFLKNDAPDSDWKDDDSDSEELAGTEYHNVPKTLQ